MHFLDFILRDSFGIEDNRESGDEEGLSQAIGVDVILQKK